MNSNTIELFESMMKDFRDCFLNAAVLIISYSLLYFLTLCYTIGLCHLYWIEIFIVIAGGQTGTMISVLRRFHISNKKYNDSI